MMRHVCDECKMEFRGSPVVVTDDGAHWTEEKLDFCGWACLLDHILGKREHEVLWDRTLQTCDELGLDRSEAFGIAQRDRDRARELESA